MRRVEAIDSYRLSPPATVTVLSSGPQILTVVGASDNWVRNSTKPTAVTYPAALGFAPGFVPTLFPQP